jgi:glycosyltransferase involved in cell wall biosynthesis/SAM-dependent methyltransferase
MATDLPFTGERYVPGINGNIFLEHMHRYVIAKRIVEGKDVLDIASGEGFGSSLLADKAKSVIGVDISEEAVAHAQAKYGAPHLNFRAGSATAIPLEDHSVDVVVSFETIEHITGHEEMLSEIKRVLRPGGVLIMSTPDKATYSDTPNYKNPFHVRELYHDEFRALLASQFAHVRMHGQKIGFGSVIVAEEGAGPFVETDSATMQSVSGLATPLYLVGIASDDPAAAVALHGLFTQDMQASDPVLLRVEFELKEAQARLEAELARRKAEQDTALDRRFREVLAHIEKSKRSVTKRSDSELQAALAGAERREAAILADIHWMSAEIATLQRSNWMSRASLLKLLRRMIKVRALYALSRMSVFSDRRRGKFLRSAEKRDPMLLSSRLDKFCQDFFHRIAQNSELTEASRAALMRHGLRVTAVVPNYNHARFLPERLDSILNQTYPLIDILVLDDCSTDDSRTVIDGYVERFPDRITAVYNEANSGGVFKQWQKGHELATGDLIWFCESDDFCETTFVERLVGHFRDPSVMLAFGRIDFANTEGNVMPGMETYLEEAEPGIWGAPLVRPAAAWFKNGFGVKNLIANVGGSIWRRAPLAQAVWDEARSFKIMGDWYLYAAVAGGGQIAYDPAARACFRIHGNNTSGASAQAKPEYYLEYTKLMTALKTRWPIPEATIERFVKSCEAIYRGAGVKSPAFDTLVSVEALKAVPTTNRHILMGLLGFSYGGGEIFPIRLANELHHRGIMVSMMQMMDTEDHPDVRAMLHPAIPIYTANGLRDRGVKAAVMEAGITLVHSHIASIEMVLFDEGHIDLPYLSTLHGSYEAMTVPKRSVTAWAGKIDRFVYLTERNLSAFEGLDVAETKFVKMRNAMPIDPAPYGRTRAEMGISEDAVVFATVGRGIEGKGFVEAVQAFLALKSRRPDVPMALLLAGEGPAIDRAKTFAEGDPDIHFLGFDSAVHGIYRMSDVALAPTRFPGESYPLCLIQALQVGRPAIATDTGEIASMLREGGEEAGLILRFLTEDEYFVAETSAAMERMLDKDLRAVLTASAARLGETYAMERLVADYIGLYDKILARRASWG